MLRRFIKIILILSIFALTNCTYIYGDKGIIQNRDTDYLKAYSIAPLKIPCGLASSTIEAHYPISDDNYPNTRRIIDLTPPELYNPPLSFAAQTPQATATTTRYDMKPAPVAELRTPRYYYDPYTRSSRRNSAGLRPDAIAGSFSSMLPRKKVCPPPATVASGSNLEENRQIAQNQNEAAEQAELSEEQHQTQQHYFDHYSHR